LAFCELNAGRLVYDHTEEQWFIWNGRRWRRDFRKRVFSDARKFTRVVKSRAAKPPKDLTKIRFVTAVDTASRTDPRIAVSFEVWDTDPWLFGTPDGVVDLRIGELKPCTPDLYISKHSLVVPAPVGTPTPVWDKFLNEATQGDKDLQGFLYRISGYALTGDVSEEVLIFF
jgi:putative DNA primase/helicase